ncbi:hypothetical protein WICPIJ_009980 [Wickerhamomyces pijperi]|uniref:Zn(2)-C6 fungal-type domain-containing protein n=1 Tax=Wickerhamomyces pijperi TaxID=599730 RepID=A0A9P8PJW0_WICPI|nr:hypothetical protein WICPIJ_009980 [Wickerhamomyces pijperi]
MEEPLQFKQEKEESVAKPSKITRTKVIKTPGSKIERIAQACDRCRLKKTKCDGRRPQCSQCELVGFECKVSDKLSRLSYPRGYTETLEQRVRELETENKKLLALLDLRKENSNSHSNSSSPPDQKISGVTQRLSSSNLSLLNRQTSALTESQHLDTLGQTKHVHSGPGCCANYPHSVHETPVSIAGSVDLEQSDDQDSLYSFNGSDSLLSPYHNSHHHHHNHHHNHQGSYNVSFEQNQAPGLNAALAIARMNNLRNNSTPSSNNNAKLQLANLVAMSIPRSTEEMLFIPSLLSKIGETYGLNSKACFLTANTIASLKQIPKASTENSARSEVNFNSLNFKNITVAESNLFFNCLQLPSKVQLDQLVTVYFQEWGVVMPMIDKREFLKQYATFLKSMENNFNDNSMMKNERFGLMLVLVCQLSLISMRSNALSRGGGGRMLSEQDLRLINYFDGLIHKLIQTSLTDICSIQSLQILALTLYYSLNTGDVITTYQLRGKVITMAQQLRLHRCPSAVLGTNGSTVSSFQQGERRILFWCIYSLDVFSSLQLGVPRLLKDYEIECALPIGIDSENGEEESNNFIIVDNSKISLVGKVFKFSLGIMRYAKVLGNILDSIFKRHSSTSGNISNHDLILIHENLLDSWRRDLPKHYQFQIDVNGSFTMDDGNETMDFKKIVLVLLYYSAKMLIHLPVIASEVEKSSRSSSIVIQQCSINILRLVKSASVQFEHQLPLPINVPRLKTRLILLSARGSLEYARGGAIFQEIKKLLGNLLHDLKMENYDINSPGNLSNACVQLLEVSVDLILGGSSANNNSSSSALSATKEVKRSSSLSSKSTSSPLGNTAALARKRNISNINDVAVQQAQEHHNQDNEGQLAQMLSQINAIPPIIKPDLNNISRVPQANNGSRVRSNSTATAATQNHHQQQHQQQQQLSSSSVENFDFNFNMKDFNFNFSNDENYEFAEFGADGSLGLEPWLNNFQDGSLNGSSASVRNNSTTKSITPPFDFPMPDHDFNSVGNGSSSSYGADLSNSQLNSNIFANDSNNDNSSLKPDVTGGSFYNGNYSINTPTPPPPSSLPQQQQNQLQQHQQALSGFQLAQQLQQNVNLNSEVGSFKVPNGSNKANTIRGNSGNSGLAGTSVKNQHQSLFDWQNSN